MERRPIEEVSRENTDQRRALPLSYLPVDGGEDWIRTNNHVQVDEVTLTSLPGKESQGEWATRVVLDDRFNVEVTLISLPCERWSQHGELHSAIRRTGAVHR
jgi:hypothetical protein